MRYPVIIEKDGDGYMAWFPDIPEALTGGDTLEETLEMAADALETALEFYFEDSREVPMPSEPKEGQETIALPTVLVEKIPLFNKELPPTPTSPSRASQGVYS